MLLPLNARTRRTTLRVGLSATIGAMSLLALALPASGVALEGGAALRHPASLPTPLPPLAVPTVDVERDPFISDRPPGPAGQITVRAIVLGASPKALVDEGGDERIVGVGDAIAGGRITGMSSDGIALDDGRHIPFDGTSP